MQVKIQNDLLQDNVMMTMDDGATSVEYVGRGGPIRRFVTFRPKGHGFESRSSRHIWTFGKSFTCRWLWCFDVKLQHSIRAVSGVPLSSRGLEQALQK